MKKLLTLLLTIASLSVFSQADLIRTKAVAQSSGASNFNKQSIVDDNLKARLNLSIPRATSFTLNNAKDTAGYVMYNTTIQRMGIYKGSGVWDTLSTGTTANYLAGYGLLKTGNTFRVDTTSIASKSYVNTGFSLKQTALNGTGFVKATGTTISYDNSTYVPTSRTLTNGFGIKTIGDLSANRSITVDTANIYTKYGTDELLSNTGVKNPDLYFLNRSEQLVDGGETSMVMEGSTLYQWYRKVGENTIYLRTANNSTLDNWTSGTLISGISGYFPTVIKDPNTAYYYMFLNTTDYTTSKKTLLYRSVDKLNWTVLNSGNSVITTGSNPTDWNYTVYNIGAVIVGSKIHILAEGTAASGFYFDRPSIGYSVADISNPVFTLTSTPQILDAGNAQLIYVKEKNSLLSFYGGYPFGLIKWKLNIATARLDEVLTNPKAWVKSASTFPELGDDTADPEFILTPGKTYKSLITYNLNQNTGYQAYNDYVDSFLKLYESLPIQGNENRKYVTINSDTIKSPLIYGATSIKSDGIALTISPNSSFLPAKIRLSSTNGSGVASGVVDLEAESVTDDVSKFNVYTRNSGTPNLVFSIDNGGNAFVNNRMTSTSSVSGNLYLPDRGGMFFNFGVNNDYYISKEGTALAYNSGMEHVFRQRVGINTYGVTTEMLEVRGNVRLSGIIRADSTISGTPGADSVVVITNGEFRKIPPNYYSTGVSGTYAPTISNNANTTALSVIYATYTRIGDICSVNAIVQFDVSTALTNADVLLTLPVGTAVANKVTGIAISEGLSTGAASVRYSSSTTAEIHVNSAPATGTQKYHVSFSYTVN